MDTTNKEHRAGFVNIIGKPNVGKSTLMNALVGERLAIITPKAQTTRHRIMGIVDGENFQIVYSDTPGIIDPQYKLHQSMMKFVSTSLQDADVLLIITEGKDKNLDLFWDKIKDLQAPKILLINKIDLMSEEEQVEMRQYWQEKVVVDEIYLVSALEKINLDMMFEKIVDCLPFHPPYYPKDELTDKPWRFFVSEIVREKIFLNYKQEIPYSVEISIETYQEEEELIRIRAIIFTNRKSHKPILIGRGGSMLKKVGIEARKDIEAFVGKQVYLELFVKIKENWRDNDFLLKQFGYTE